MRVADKSENSCQLHQVRFRCVVVLRRLDPFICILNYHVPIRRSCEDRIACPELHDLKSTIRPGFASHPAGAPTIVLNSTPNEPSEDDEQPANV